MTRGSNTRWVTALLCLLFLRDIPFEAWITPATAAESVQIQDERKVLFEALKNARSETEGRIAAARIWHMWFRAPNDAIDALMKQAMEARQAGRVRDSIIVLDKVVERAPDYAEGWNQRATMLYLAGDLDKSLADIVRVLELEPKHFGALSGRVLIYRRQGRFEEAVRTLHEVLEIHPWSPERYMLPQKPKPGTPKSKTKERDI